MPMRSYADQMVELNRIFKLKRIFKAWRETRSYIDSFEDSFERVLSLNNGANRKSTRAPSKNLQAQIKSLTG